MTDFDVLMIGNFAKDKIIIDGVEDIASGGGVYYGSVVVKKLGYRVAVVTRLHPDDFFRLDELRKQGVVVFATPAEGTSGIANYYQSQDMERRICKPIGFGGKYHPDHIPDIQAKTIMLTPLFAGEVDLEFLQKMALRAPIALDIQGFIRVPSNNGLDFEPWADLEKGLACVTFLKLDRAEAEHLTGLTNIHDAAQRLSSLGPQEIVLTESAGVTVFAKGKFYFSPFHPRSLAGRTGRGDTCFSTYISKRIDCEPEISCKWAAEVTSLKQEIPGPWQGSAQDIQIL